MGQRIIITEDEIKKIKEMYNLNEAISFSNVFKDIKSSIGDSVNYIKKIKNYSKLGVVSLTMLLSLLSACDNLGQTDNANQTAEFILEERWKGSDEEKLYYAMQMYSIPIKLSGTDYDTTFNKQLWDFYDLNPKQNMLAEYSEYVLIKGKSYAEAQINDRIRFKSDMEKLENSDRTFDGLDPLELKWNKEEIWDYIHSVENELKNNPQKVNELVKFGILNLVSAYEETKVEQPYGFYKDKIDYK